MYRFGSNIQWVYESVNGMDVNSDEVIKVKGMPFDLSDFRMNLSKVSRDNAMMFITRVIDDGEALYVRRIK